MSHNENAIILKSFAKNFYDWSRQDSLAEAHRNFEIVRRIPSVLCWRFLEFMDSLPVDQREKLIEGLVLRSNAIRLETWKERLPSGDEPVVQRWLAPRGLALTKHQRDLYSKKQKGTLRLVSRREISAAAISVVTELLGSEPDPWGGGVYRWTVRLGSVSVHTDVDIGARSRQLTYFHSISTTAGDLYLVERTSLLGWMGVAGMTTWEFVEQDQIDEFTKVFKIIMLRFLDAVPMFTKGVETE